MFALLELYKQGEATWDQAEPFGRGLDDAAIGLVRNDPVDIRCGNAGVRQHFGQDIRQVDDRVAKDFARSDAIRDALHFVKVVGRDEHRATLAAKRVTSRERDHPLDVAVSRELEHHEGAVARSGRRGGPKP